MAFESARRVGDYEILGVLGAGGMGKVYRVRNVISNRVEAMKVLLPDSAVEPGLAERLGEAATARLRATDPWSAFASGLLAAYGRVLTDR